MLKVDLHTHSIASGHGINTVYEMVYAAKNKELELLGLTEHGPRYQGGPPSSYFVVANRLPRNIFGLDVLIGCEANVLDSDGNLDLNGNQLVGLDLVLAGLHPGAGWVGKSTTESTDALLATMKNPSIDIITHPCSPMFKVDIDRIVKTSYEYKIMLELNCEHLSYYENRGIGINDVLRLIRLIKEYKWKLVISSDAHMVSEIGEDAVIDRLKLRGLLSDDTVLNTSAMNVRRYLEDRKKGKRRQIN